MTGFISLVEGTNVVLPELPIQSPRPVQLLQEPVLSCMHEIAQADVVGLQQVLIGALEKHKLFFDNDENRTEPLGWVSLMLSAITSISQDRGFDLKVKSDYLFGDLIKF